LDDHHEMMRETFRRVAEEVVMPLAEEIHRHDLDIPDAILDQVKELGCFGISIPERFGGIQSDEQEDNLGMIVVTEELTRGSLGAAGSLITRPEILSKALLKGGTEEQKMRWLPQLASGDVLCAVAVTEPNYGSDVANMRLKATRAEGGWLLNGAKTWCTFGGKAGVLLILARTNPDLSLGHRGLSMFLLEKPSTPGHAFEFKQDGGGVLTGKAIPTIGYRGMHSFDLFFDNVFVPEENMLGGPKGEGKGFYFTMAGFAGGRIQTAARAVGLMQAAYEKALSYSQERVVFGYPIGDYQLTQIKLARMATYLAVSRQFTYAVGRLMDRGEGDMEASMVKLFTCKTAEWVTREALQIHGGMGYAEEVPVSRYFIDARVLSIFEGAEETLALKVITRSLVDNAKAKAEVGG
jgi:(2S)-methylsuccinyl-CoA dehydrogenase